MAFTVGWPDGNSAVSVAYADGYFSDRGIPDWAGIDAVKQGALVRATDYVRAIFGPRLNPDLFLVVDVIPEALAKAVAEYALIELKTPGSLAPAPVVDASGYAVVTTAKKVGPIEKQFAPVASRTNPKAVARRRWPIPDALMAQIILPASGYGRTMR